MGLSSDRQNMIILDHRKKATEGRFTLAFDRKRASCEWQELASIMRSDQILGRQVTGVYWGKDIDRGC